jgi:hypothetical protein
MDHCRGAAAPPFFSRPNFGILAAASDFPSQIRRRITYILVEVTDEEH